MGMTTALTGALRTADQPAGVSSSARVAEQYRQANAGALRLRLGGSLATSLDSALRRLDAAATAFTWPAAGSPFATGARLAVAPSERKADLTVNLPAAGSAPQEDKQLSRGFTASAQAGLDPGTYTLKLGLGGSSDTLSVTVESGDTNRDVLDAFAAAVNGSTLQVDASVRSQTGSNILGAGVIPTGSFLVLSVNQTRAGQWQDQSPTLTDTSGHLGAWLDLSATSAPLAPAETGTHQLTSLSVARPTLYRSTGLDPEAATTLAPGTYTVAYAVGPDSGSVTDGSLDIVVSAGDTWRDVLAHMKSVFGSASAFMTSQLVPAKRVWDSATDEKHAVVDATGLEIQLNDPKPGWRLSLSGGGADVGTDNILSALGLNVTAQPGSDGRMVVDGRDQTRTPGTFSVDQGRVVLEDSGTFGAVVPVSVQAPLDLLSQGLTDVVMAYNDLRGLLTKSADLLRPGLAEDWRKPVADRAVALQGLGLAESGRDRLLWLTTDGFVQSLVANPAMVKQTLLGDGADQPGLLSELSKKAQDALVAGAESLLKPQSSFAARDPFLASTNPRTEVELEKASQLLDLLDSANTLSAEPYPWEGGAALLRRKG